MRHDTAPSARRLDNQEPMITRIAPASKKTVRFEPVDKARDLAFVSAHGLGQLSGGSLSLLRTMHEHGRFLRGHPESAKTTIKRCLQSYAGTEEPCDRELGLPLSDAGIFPLRLPRCDQGIPQQSPVLPGLRSFCHRFGRRGFSAYVCKPLIPAAHSSPSRNGSPPLPNTTEA